LRQRDLLACVARECEVRGGLTLVHHPRSLAIDIAEKPEHRLSDAFHVTKRPRAVAVRDHRGSMPQAFAAASTNTHVRGRTVLDLVGCLVS